MLIIEKRRIGVAQDKTAPTSAITTTQTLPLTMHVQLDRLPHGRNGADFGVLGHTGERLLVE